MKNILFKTFLIFLLILPVSLSAYDFGLVVNANGGYGNNLAEDNTFSYKIDLWPRFSTLIGDNGELIISAVFSVGNEYGFSYIPELLRTEFNMRFGNSGIRAGRINYSDPLALIANGLFDGVQFYNNSNAGTLRVGAWYTGFLYKKRANIVMSESDETEFFEPLDYGDFSNTYFASKRLFASIGWEHPSLGELLHLNTAIIGQMDLNGAYTSYNNEYAVVKIGIPIKNFLMEFGGSVEFSQVSFDDNNSDNNGNFISFAGDIGLSLLFPSQYSSRLLLKGIIAGGKKDEDTSGAFTPITSDEYGYILKTRIAGLSVFSLNYLSKFNRFFSGSFTASYFVRNDLGTFYGYPIEADSKGYFLGLEPSVKFTWSPTSDLQFNLGGGAFLPSLGNAGKEEKVKWRVDLTVIMLLL
ncbi:MAG: hypothetical protein FWF68_04770 [Spirochaetes bacterium]|nr:hypothetical protein [Spirochaetota bacterium]